MKRYVVVFAMALSILFLFAAFNQAVGKKGYEQLNPTQTIENENTPLNYTHTVFVEVATSQACYPCHLWNQNIHDTYDSGNYDFEYVEMIVYDDSWNVLNSEAYDTMVNGYGVSSYPTSVFDGDYTTLVGNYPDQLPDKLNQSGNRTVADVLGNITVTWLGNATMDVNISVQNNEETQYNGSIRVYITEIESRYDTAGGDSYHFGFLDYALDENISISAESNYTNSTTWNGNNYEDEHGDDYGDITSDNIKVIMAVFSDEDSYVDETVTATPVNDTVPPQINNIQATPPSQQPGEHVNITCNVTDNLQTDVVMANITSPDSSTTNISMTNVAGTETFYYNSTYTNTGTYSYFIWANDTSNNANTSNTNQFTITDSNNPPNIPSTPSGPTWVWALEENNYSTSTTDPDGDDVYYKFDWGDGTQSGWIGPYSSGATATANHSWCPCAETTYYVSVKAKDEDDAESGWSSSLGVYVEVNDNPSTPSIPSGSSEGVAGISYTYNTSSTDPDGSHDKLKYKFYWGDGSYSWSDWFTPGETASASHIWDSKGTYNIKAMAQDKHGATSSWSNPFTVTISSNASNNPPSQPSDPSPVDGATNVSLNPPLGCTVSDPDNDSLDVTFYGIIGGGDGGGCEPVNASLYCSRSGDTGYEWITRVELPGIDHSSGKDGYLDATNQVSNSLTPGAAFAVNVTIGQTGSYDEYVTIYIDWNQDHDLEDAGEAYQLGMTDEDGGVITGTIEVPTDAVPGSTLLRVAQEYDAFPAGPCSQEYGDTEDYTVCISGDGDGNETVVIGTAEDVASGDTASVVWHNLSSNTSYSWYAVANDSLLSTQSDTWSFTTITEEYGKWYGI